MSTTPVPARLHVLLARDAPTAVVIRRGPAKHVCTIGWDRRDDTFTMGQWLKGRIYEERCDLSPDGVHFIYFALTGRWASETKGAYTALSRAPYLKALGLWPEGSTWGGGGLFADSRSYWVGRGGAPPLRTPDRLREVARCPWPNPGYGWQPIYGARLARDGWRLVGVERAALGGLAGALARMLVPSAGVPPEEPEPGVVATFARPAAHPWVLHKRLYSRIRGAGPFTYEGLRLVHTPTGRRIDLPDWEWADVDGDRLVWAESGRLCAGVVDDDGLRATTVLRDFNDMRFEPIAAPY